jgi:hypothetical protein
MVINSIITESNLITFFALLFLTLVVIGVVEASEKIEKMGDNEQ